MLKENAKKVFNYAKENDGKDFTAQDIADAIDVPVKSVNGIITQAFQRHKNAAKVAEPLMERVPAEIELEDGSHKPIKLIRLTDAGRAFDPDAEAAVAED